MDKEAQEKITEILDDITGGDTEFDREGGYSPVEDYCDEMATQILKALEKLGYRKLSKNRPPLLSNEYQYRAQWEADIRHYEED